MADAAITEDVAQCEVMGSVDSGDVDRFVLADPSQDESWVTVALTDAKALSDWR